MDHDRTSSGTGTEPATNTPGPGSSDPVLGEAGGQLDRVQDTLGRLTQLVEDARSMPLSASCVLNRSEVLGLLDELRVGLPGVVGEARQLLSERGSVVAAGRRQAGELLEQARAEQARLVSASAVLTEAQTQADDLIGASQHEAETLRREVEDYVDGKLATFEVVLTKTLEAVHRGRSQLEGTPPSELSTLDDDRQGDASDGPLPDPGRADPDEVSGGSGAAAPAPPNR